MKTNNSSTCKKGIHLLGSALAIFVLVGLTVLGKSANADVNVADLQKQIDDKNQKIQALNVEIAKYQSLASEANQQSSTLKQVINSLEKDRQKLTLETKKIQTQIDATNLSIKQLNSKITDSKSKISILQDGLEKSLREISQNDNFHVVVTLLNDKSFSDFFGRLDDQAQFNNSIKDKVTSILNEKKKLEDNKTAVEKTKKELADLKTQLDGKKKVVEYTKTEQQKILVDTKSQEKTYQTLVADRTAQKNAFEQEVFLYESKLKFNADPNALPVPGSSPLGWPVDDVRITQYFGRTVGAKKLYVSGSHNGVDFGVPIGTPVKALASGVVAGAGDTDLDCRRVSFGRWILIKFNNGLAATYGHLSVIGVKTGDSVQAGQVIGYSGNTGYSTGPHVHISAYVSTAVNVMTRPSASCPGKNLTMPVSPIDAYLDPMLYWPKI
ncbi:MAG: peptidoglycan DD-metalloendopeptidase family protein [bacterium]